MLQRSCTKVINAVSTNPVLFGTHLVEQGFTANTVSGIVNTSGLSNYDKAFRLLNIVDTRLRTSSRDFAKVFFDNLVLILNKHLKFVEVAEELVATYSKFSLLTCKPCEVPNECCLVVNVWIKGRN